MAGLARCRQFLPVMKSRVQALRSCSSLALQTTVLDLEDRKADEEEKKSNDKSENQSEQEPEPEEEKPELLIR